MKAPIRILLQTTIFKTDDDWDIRRFQLLSDYLASIPGEEGEPLFAVTARNREADIEGSDPVLSSLDRAHFDELWLFAVDVGDGLSAADCAGINAFYAEGGGLLLARDHMDLGCSLCNLGSVGAAHHFHTKNPESDPARRCIDDPYTTTILWPNYHSGRNGDYQKIKVQQPLHPLLANSEAPSGHIEYFPAHPHEGAVEVPAGAANAQAIACGTSQVTGRCFNLAIAFERTEATGRAVCESTFHHFADYNWDTRSGCPSFVNEPPGTTMQSEPRALADTHTYVRNLALWLAPQSA
ncbi:hypothetical protein [Gloeobacter kilaueensis]|uniref:ThuA-like domain-containing protein n=1 Tax=Gloeobacter kilaueensis (strain ATCC BAA-2537 / CCAP 1431/1 / ULC 316 / JS1) TaxID=1183438 RepID=U5QFH8_GLOK1|nr:hypothetical protein [Gloeobacter kilaueensis]AGY57638.1 hypothetical protein GKIL_1392 [Gloeobacter kilaueensis JS1]